ncbi:uncharacterized protein BXZ73DRAFT_52011 [Epithele typhae]|uniref:uncharacterized protein n=1 Tax=Epithele typhae TaxID=378194 RepID=UPI002008566D|nr:uncharacterized protein BXZ73DRAFT_52011 [Epithele typhae]KAH9920837.1 hypothetical protein BXZ73DRAFT_52011 [Epithele typhae]
MHRRLPPAHNYVRLAVAPPCNDAITLRRTIQTALGQSFGLVSSHTYVDVLWIAEEGTEAVVRISPSETEKLLAAVAAASALPRLSLVKQSTFLPSLLSTNVIF